MHIETVAVPRAVVQGVAPLLLDLEVLLLHLLPQRLLACSSLGVGLVRCRLHRRRCLHGRRQLQGRLLALTLGILALGILGLGCLRLSLGGGLVILPTLHSHWP